MHALLDSTPHPAAVRRRSSKLRTVALALGVTVLFGGACASESDETDDPDPAPIPTGGNACDRNADCDADFGYACIDGTCALTCVVHEHCGSEGACTGTATDAAGTTVRICQPDGLPRGKGQYGTLCPFGDECDAEAGFVCIGAGPGDIDAYCTLRDCAADTDCPSGYYCSRQLARVRPCNDVCTFPGRDAPDCVPDAEIGPGLPYECGALALERNACLLRSFCNTCESDTDCLGLPNQICARDPSGAKICTVQCDPQVNSCPWGSAAICGVWDTELGIATCSHRFGQCTGQGLSCEPCVDQADCPLGYCEQSSFTGERYCVDFSAICSCPEGTAVSCIDGGCPVTPAPALRPMTCYGGSYFADTSIFQKCIGSATDRAEEGEPESCWPAL